MKTYLKHIVSVVGVLIACAFFIPHQASAQTYFTITNAHGTYGVEYNHFRGTQEATAAQYAQWQAAFKQTASTYLNQSGPGLYQFTQTCGNQNQILITLIKATPKKKSLCKNIPAAKSVPAGDVVDAFGNCVSANNSATDLCPNLDGLQATIPDGFLYDVASQTCLQKSNDILLKGDVCPNVDGLQTTIPSGDIFDKYNNCVQEGFATDTASENNICEMSLIGQQCSTGGTCGGVNDGTLICTSTGLKCQHNSNVQCDGAAIDSFTSKPTDVKKLGQCTLSWQTEGATQCTVTNDHGGVLVPTATIPDGTSLTEPITQTDHYTLTCTGKNKVPVSAAPVTCRLVSTETEQ